MRRLIIDDIRVSVRRPQMVVAALLILVVPPVSGYVSLPAYAFSHWTAYFTVMIDAVALIFPLLITLITQPRLLDEWSNSYALATRQRVEPARYFGARVAAWAILAAVVFLVLTIVCFAVARWTYSYPSPEGPPGVLVETRYQFSQLWAVSPALYLVVYCLWVALVSGTVAAVCTLITAVVGNKFVALAAPFVLWSLTDFGLAVLDLAALSLPPFRFHIKQQPIWTEFAGWALILIVLGALYLYVHRRDYQTAGIVRT